MSTDADQKRLRAAMELVDAALDAPPSQRAALLGDASSEVRAEAERLLAADACTNSVLSEPALAGAPSALDEATRAGTNALAPGAQVGSFRIVSFLGRGGMGEVWIAERATADFDQRVALKILPVTDAAAVARFRQERRILARLAHPCIARLLDGGVMSDGRPWLAMELVAGKNLVDYCAEHELDVDARLHLFAQICDAVQLAHQSLVVHRDLKPSNILVGDDGAPKLLDFGIAKLLEHAADAEPLTRTHERPMTLDYAAPEQVRGEAISTASDIWSLGVILHELLTGVRPYRTTGKNRVETEHAILAAEPSRPSAHVDDPLARGRPLAASPRALRRRLRGDLDAIVLKAMRKAPKDRYATAEALAADVRRHLDHAPVAARGDATSYLVRATIRRHSVAFAFSGVVFVALVAGLVGTLWQAKRARDEARRAEQAQAFLVDMLRAFDPGQANGKPITQRDILERGEARLGELDTQPDVQALLLHTFAETWYGIEEFVHAEKTAERALDLERRTRGPRSLEAGRSLVLIGDSWFELGDYPRAASSLEEGLAILRAIEGPKGLTVASALNDLAGVKRKLTEFAEAEKLRREALAITRERLGDEDRQTLDLMNDLAVLLGDEQRWEESTELQQRTCTLMAKTRGAANPDTLVCRSNVARNLIEVGRASDAEATLMDVEATEARVLGPDWPAIAASELLRGRALEAQGRHAEAVAVYEDALARGKRLGDHPQNASILGYESMSLRALGKPQEADAAARRALAMCEKTVGVSHAYAGRARYALGTALFDEGRVDEAREELRGAVAVLDARLGPNNSDSVRARAALASAEAAK